MFFILSLLVVMIMMPSVYAAEVGNLYQCERGKFKLEFKVEQQVRQVELDGGEAVRSSVLIRDVEGKETLDRYYLKGSFAPIQNLEIYAKVGLGRLDADFNTFEEFEYQTQLQGQQWFHRKGIGRQYNIMAGIGGKFIFFQSGNFQAGIDMQYIYQEGDDFTLFNNYSYDISYAYFDFAKITKTETHEVQGALIINNKMGNFTPYGGIKVSYYATNYDGKYKKLESGLFDEGNMDFKTRQKDYLGMFVGADYNFNDNFGVNVEGRLGDEQSATCGLYFTF